MSSRKREKERKRVGTNLLEREGVEQVGARETAHRVNGCPRNRLVPLGLALHAQLRGR